MRKLISYQLEEALFLEPSDFDEAILGVAHRYGMDPVVAYDRTSTYVQRENLCCY